MTAKELKLDYFQIYDLENRPAAGNILLQGQFDDKRLKMQVALVDFFGNPVSKNGEPLYDKNAHLAWYRGVQPAEPIRRVILENQFGKFDIRTGTGYGMLVPTQKVEPGSVFPQALDHYKVYRLVDVEQVPHVTIKLKDQFGSLRDAAAASALLRGPGGETARHEGLSDPQQDRAPVDLQHQRSQRREEDHAAQPVLARHIGQRRPQRDAGGPSLKRDGSLRIAARSFVVRPKPLAARR